MYVTDVWLMHSECDADIICRSYSCPCPGAACHWFGFIDEVHQHLTTQHSTITTLIGMCAAILHTHYL